MGGFDKNLQYVLVPKGGEAGKMPNGKNECVIIDASLPSNSMKIPEDMKPTSILLTHTHRDHIVYLRNLQRVWTGIKVGVHQSAADKIKAKDIIQLKDETSLTVGGIDIKPIHTPGHYPDSMCFLIDDALFTGDTLFIGRTGRTVGALADTGELYHSIYDKLLDLPGSTMIYPGHDYGVEPRMTLSENIKISDLLQATSEENFIHRMKEYERIRQSNN